MQTQAIPDRNSGRNYREFSRRRYNELKNMRGASMRESEIIQRIIREWDQIQIANKNKRNTREGSRVPATPMKEDERVVPLEIKDQKLLRSTNAKKEEEEANEERSSFQHELNNVIVRPFDAPSPLAKEKKIRKAKMGSNYITFYRNRYDEIMKKHPHWTSTQATVIVKLMWKNQKSKSRRGKGNAQKPARPMRVLSGRMTFKRFKMQEGMKVDQIKNKWKKLPFESKRMWAVRGNPQAGERKRMTEMKMKLGQDSRMDSLNNMMMRRMKE